MTERKGGLSPQAREFVAVGASVGAGCHPCVTHHLKAGAEAGLGAQELEAAITAAERVIADSSARMAQHARRQLPAPAGSAGADGPAVAVALAALGAAVAANSMPNIERYLTEAAQLDVSGGELTDAVNVAHEVQRNAARIHAQRTGELLDAPPAAGQTAAASAAAGQEGECEESCPCHDDDGSVGTGPAPAQDGIPAGEATPAAGGCADAAAAEDEPPAATASQPPQAAAGQDDAARTPMGGCTPTPAMLSACCAGMTPILQALCWVRRAVSPLRNARWTPAQGVPRVSGSG